MTDYSVECPYCKQPARLTNGSVIYPHRKDLAKKKFWLCSICSAYCGCHPGTKQPLGTPANRGLRSLRSQVHLAFDPLWQHRNVERAERAKIRKAAYELFAQWMGMTEQECHIGLFSEEQCKKALSVLDKKRRECQNAPL